MRPRTFRLSEPEALALHSAYLHCQHAESKIRYQAVRLYGLGYSVAQILEICGGSRSSLMDWVVAYQHKGLPALLDQRQGGNRLACVLTKSKPWRTNCIGTPRCNS